MLFDEVGMHAERTPDNHELLRVVTTLSDDELLHALNGAVARSRRVEAEIVAHIAEVDERRLYAREASPSMFAYCLEALHLSEHEAYVRITAARATRLHPVLLAMLGDGRLHLSGIAKLAPHLTLANRDGVLARAAHRSKREIEELVAELAPKADAPDVVRKVPAPRPLTSAPAGGPLLPEAVPDRTGLVAVFPSRPALIRPTAPDRYKVQFTASAALRAKLDRLVALMRHRIPDGDLAAVLEDAVTEKLVRLEAKRFARGKPRKALAAATTVATGSRYIPAPVRRLVAERDGDRCSFVGEGGRRCTERSRLEFDHARPHARGGDRSAENIRLMCRTHNAYLAQLAFGPGKMPPQRPLAGAKESETNPP